MELSKEIKVVGIEIAGILAIRQMNKIGLLDVDIIACGTEMEVLEDIDVLNRILITTKKTNYKDFKGRYGKIDVVETLQDIPKLLSINTKMLIVVGGLSGLVGSTALPQLAASFHSMDILTIGIGIIPSTIGSAFKTEQDDNIEKLQKATDCLILINSSGLKEVQVAIQNASKVSDQVALITAGAVKSITNLINAPGQINIELADVDYVMRNSGIAYYGFGTGSGDDRATIAIKQALRYLKIKGAKKILMNIGSSKNHQVLIDEVTEMTEWVQDAAGKETDILFGTSDDESLEEKLSVTVIATGYSGKESNKSKIRDVFEKAGQVVSYSVIENDNNLSLYFNLDEFSLNEIGEVISYIDGIYKEIGGDSIEIKGQSILEMKANLISV